MNTKQTDTNRRETHAIPSLGCVEDDIREALRETGRRCIQQILDTLEHRYRQNQDVGITPQNMWPILRKRSRQLYAEYADQVTQEFSRSHDGLCS